MSCYVFELLANLQLCVCLKRYSCYVVVCIQVIYRVPNITASGARCSLTASTASYLQVYHTDCCLYWFTFDSFFL